MGQVSTTNNGLHLYCFNMVYLKFSPKRKSITYIFGQVNGDKVLSLYGYNFKKSTPITADRERCGLN